MLLCGATTFPMISLSATGSPISIIFVLKRSRSSASLIVSIGVPSGFDAVFFEDPGLVEFDGQVQSGLAAQRRQQCVRAARAR